MLAVNIPICYFFILLAGCSFIGNVLMGVGKSKFARIFDNILRLGGGSFRICSFCVHYLVKICKIMYLKMADLEEALHISKQGVRT